MKSILCNNIININYSGSSNMNATLRLKDNSVNLIPFDSYGDTHLKRSDQGGIYQAALIPEIATYPNSFPSDNS
jgi:hypothetical protein